MKDIIVAADRVSRMYETGKRRFYALQDVSIEACPGELVVLRGRSGSGKTTLLNLLAGLDNPTQGEVYLRGKPMGRMRQAARDRMRQRDIGMVFQSMALFPFLSAVENVELALRMHGARAQDRRARCEACLRFVGLGERMRHRPQEMSGGEQQRVAIARAVVLEPSLLLADEPTAALDTRMGQEVMNLFARLAKEKGLCVVLTTHDPVVMARADRVYTLEDGRLVDDV